MRILFVTPYVPSLIRVRPYNFIRQLSKRHEVTLVSLAQDGSHDADAAEQLTRFCDGVYIIPLNKTGSLVRCCRRLLSRMPLQAAYTDLASGRDLVNTACESGSFDLLHVEHIRGAHLVGGIGDLPRVYDSVDCITRLLKKRLADGCNAFQRVLNYEELWKMRSYEPKVAATFDSVIITSERDKRVLEWLMRRFAVSNGDSAHGQHRSFADYVRNAGESMWNGSSSVSVVGNGVDSEYFRPMPAQSSSAEIVFSGKMRYFPNVAAVLDFYRDVFPLIRRQRPDATFKIVGSNPPESIRRLPKRDPAVKVTGYLDDIRPQLASAAVVVCPLSVGVGVQNKVLEAMAMGKPIVASSVALSGVRGAVNGLHLIRADRADQVAEAVLGLMENPDLGREMGEQARRFVVQSYSWEAAVGDLEDVYARVVDSCRSRTLAAA